MNHLVLVEELRATLAEIRKCNDELGLLNQSAITLQNKLHALEGLRHRIEVDLTTVKLEVH